MKPEQTSALFALIRYGRLSVSMQKALREYFEAEGEKPDVDQLARKHKLVLKTLRNKITLCRRVMRQSYTLITGLQPH